MSISRMVIKTLVLACVAASSASYAQQQCFNAAAPNPLEACVTATGTPAVWLLQGANRANQYFGDYAWGSAIFLDGVNPAQRYATGYLNNQVTPVALPVTGVSNTQTGNGTVADPFVITTVTALGTSGVQFTQIFTYVNGDRQIHKRWELENTGSDTFNDVRFFHGGDSYFGGVDAARSWYDANNGMVYISNNAFADTGYMGFYANPATPASAYYAGYFYDGNLQALAGQLSSTNDSDYRDAGYYLQWNRASLAPGARWAIEATEEWSEAGSLQVISPADDYAEPGQTLSRTFSIQNFDPSNGVTAELSLAALPTGWSADIVSPASPLTLAALEQHSVQVAITVSESAAAGDIQDIVLNATANGVTNQASLRLEVQALNYEITPTALNFGNVTVGSTAQLPISLNNNPAGLPLDVASIISGLGTDFSITSDSCSNTTVAAAASCSVVLQYAPTQAGAVNGKLTIPFTAPVTTTRTVTVNATGEAVVITPTAAVPVPSSSAWSLGALMALLAAAGTVSAKRRRA